MMSRRDKEPSVPIRIVAITPFVTAIIIIMTSKDSSLVIDGNLSRIVGVAAVQVFDDANGLYGEILPPDIVLEGLLQKNQIQDDVGHPGHIIPMTMCSLPMVEGNGDEKEKDACFVEFENATPSILMVRWLDEQGHSHDPDIVVEAFSSSVQESRVGFMYCLSSVMNTSQDDDSELLLGAYRLRMQLPSQSFHYLRVESTPTDNDDHESICNTSFIVESLLVDAMDELVVAAESLDTVAATLHKSDLTKTIKTLLTIVRNIVTHPYDEKYHSLRLSNPSMQKNIAYHWGAMLMLKLVGFVRERKPFTNSIDSASATNEEDDEEYLTWKRLPNDNESKQQEKLNRALALLELLKQRSEPGFLAELAHSPPWQPPTPVSTTKPRRRSFGTPDSRSFLSDDQKWKRIERGKQRRGKCGRRPNPGSAPSSNGKWGR